MLVPAGADLVYDFLPVAWRTIQHYGVELHGLRYDGPGVNAVPQPPQRHHRAACREVAGPVRSRRHPPRVLPGPATATSGTRCSWEHHSEIAVPFSAETLAYARRLARQTDRFPDDRRALASCSSAGTRG